MRAGRWRGGCPRGALLSDGERASVVLVRVRVLVRVPGAESGVFVAVVELVAPLAGVMLDAELDGDRAALRERDASLRGGYEVLGARARLEVLAAVVHHLAVAVARVWSDEFGHLRGGVSRGVERLESRGVLAETRLGPEPRRVLRLAPAVFRLLLAADGRVRLEDLVGRQRGAILEEVHLEVPGARGDLLPGDAPIVQVVPGGGLRAHAGVDVRAPSVNRTPARRHRARGGDPRRRWVRWSAGRRGRSREDAVISLARAAVDI